MKKTSSRRLLVALSIATSLTGLAATLMVFAQDRVFDVDSFATTALESDAAVRVVEAVALEAHQLIFSSGNDSLVLELSDLVISIEQALTAVSPDLAAAIPDEVASLSVELSSGEIAPQMVRLAERLRTLTIALVAVTMVLLIAMVVLESSLFLGLARMGFVLGFIGLFLVVPRAEQGGSRRGRSRHRVRGRNARLDDRTSDGTRLATRSARRVMPPLIMAR